MGQYYRSVFLDKENKEKVETFVDTGSWYKPEDLSWWGKFEEIFMMKDYHINFLEHTMKQGEINYKKSLVFVGDYDDSDLYRQVKELPKEKVIKTKENNYEVFDYFVNHTKKLYVDKTKSVLNPVVILTYKTNEDEIEYYGQDSHLLGTWVGDELSIEKEIPIGYTELVCNFCEDDI